MFLLNILEAVLAYDLVKIRFMKEKEVILNGNTNDKSRGIQLIGPGYFQRVIKGVNWLLSPIHPVHNKIYNRTSATGSDSDQPALPRSLRAIQILINKNPCHTGWMYRLIWVFAGRRGLIVGFVVWWLISNVMIILARCNGWSEYVLFPYTPVPHYAQRTKKVLMQVADNAGQNQPARMRRLILAFDVRL